MWATDTIPAEYPPVVAFKAHVDAYILEHYGITVEHYCATRVDGVEKEKVTYNDGFYHVLQSGNNAGTIKGFPMQRGPWCQKLKLEALKQAEKMTYEKLFYHIRESGNRKGEICGFPFIGYPECQKALKIGAIRKMEKAITESGGKLVQYLGIAADEPDRIATHIGKEGIKLPLVELGWEEDLCGLWCKYNGLLSPTYETSARDGCWFCHNQGVDQLRSLRKMYPALWALLLKWDADSPVTFKPGYRDKNGVYHPGKTVHDYEERFQLEDMGLIQQNEKFRWNMIEDGGVNYRLF